MNANNTRGEKQMLQSVRVVETLPANNTRDSETRIMCGVQMCDVVIIIITTRLSRFIAVLSDISQRERERENKKN